VIHRWSSTLSAGNGGAGENGIRLSMEFDIVDGRHHTSMEFDIAELESVGTDMVRRRRWSSTLLTVGTEAPLCGLIRAFDEDYRCCCRK